MYAVPMGYRILADGVLLLHLLFILFVVIGGLLVWRWPRLIWLHLPAAVWGSALEFGGWRCPLTPIENHFRQAAGEAGYATGFIEHYLLSLIYPGALTREMQIGLGVLVIALNLVIYGGFWYRRKA